MDTVLFARDKFLRPLTGIMLPDKAVLYMCAIEDAEYKADKVRGEERRAEQRRREHICANVCVCLCVVCLSDCLTV